MMSLAYLASRFPEFDVGPMVLGQNYRNPFHLEQMEAALQTLFSSNTGECYTLLRSGNGADW